MGAYEFRVFQQGADLKTAFRKAREEAQWEHGHGGYSGTIAEKDDVVQINRKIYSLEEAQVLADELRDDERVADKWGPAGAIRVKGGTMRVFVGGLSTDPKTGWHDIERDGWLFFGYASS